ncbi:universal stress protein [Azoarcus sp. KH32C]|uniref:universal stress protein n=1 Tax=Azoarcus sp. KH32C TaxID=748247 RepID=UPI0002386E9A|nr:universal stress protein [Azoarcus sp. KH32C]BAL23915.1 universal stress protein [Azoarcus sp. KH32C]
MAYGIQNILIATDLGPHSADVLKHAAGMAQRLGAQLHLVTVMYSSAQNSMVALDSYLPEEAIPRLREDAVRRIRERIDEEIADLGKDASLAGVTSVGILEGAPADIVLAEAQRLEADLIVLGSAGHTALGEILIGSVAHRVTVKSTVPVLLVPINH